ncbi:PKD domain-containing protein [Segeticoccus rhizosphaerae]|uniref:PKD domain-containing protein n=1 Tax=Segeticoccus rhizosphaerae TaxID=1104777 RepID=UPI00192E72AB|nr:PKD domain-containing protein [Ornithinicoccus soli]
MKSVEMIFRQWVHRGITGVLVIALALVVTAVPQPASADTGDIGIQDQSFSGVTNPPTSDKPQSKLWFNDSAWWAVMFDTVSLTWRIYRLDRTSETWIDTGTPVDDRPQTLSDALWDGQHLYIASHWVTTSSQTTAKASISGKPTLLYRYSYNAATKAYTLDYGFPSQINGSSSESLTIDEDSVGRIWATWTQVSGSALTGYTTAVYVNYSMGGAAWVAPTVLPVTGAHPSPDDISAVVAFNGKVGVMWSNQLDDTMYWAVRPDSSPVTNWSGSIAVRGSHQADDHINLKTLQADQSGRVYAAVKTSLDEAAGAPTSSPQLNLLVFKPGTGAWTSTTFGTVADCHTRPIVMLDGEDDQVRMFATAPTASGCPYAGAPGTIYEKVASMDNPVFSPGRGTPVIRDADSAGMNNVTSTKQSVNSATGLVILASNTSTDRYWHADLTLPSQPVAPPVASFTASPTSGTAPLTVTFTDTSTGSPTSWAWDFGNGETSNKQNPSVTYEAGGVYTVQMSATNAAGTGATPASTTVTVDQPPASTGIIRGSDSTAVATTAADGLTIDPPAGTSAGDVLVACLALNGTSVSGTGVPDGWTRIATTTGTSQSNPRVYGYYKIAGASEPSSYHWGYSKSVTSSGGIARYTGASAPETEVSIASGPSANTATLPGITTTAADDVLLGCMGLNTGATSITITAPQEMTQVWDLDGKRQEFDDAPLSQAGPTGPRTWQFSQSREWAGWLTAIRPADQTLPSQPVAPPVASFTASPTSGTAPLTVTFTDTSTGSPTSWAWDFGNGETSNKQNPSVTYEAGGVYTVQMSATNAAGTGATPASTTVTVDQPPASTGIIRGSDSTAVATTAADGLTIDPPAGTSAGDVLVACLALNGTSVSGTGVPDGWTRIATTTGTSQSNPRVYGYYKIAGASEPSSYHWGYSKSVTSSGGIARYTGASAPETEVSIASGPSANTATLPGITTTAADDVLLGCMGLNTGATSITITAPQEMTQVWDLDGKRQEFDDAPLSQAGPTGPRTWQFSQSREWAGWLTAIRPL